MNTNITELIRKLPDYEDFMNLASEIERLSYEKSKLEIQIKTKESEIVKLVTTDTRFFQNGKVPAMNYINDVYKYTGINGELIPFRESYADVSSQLDKLKIKMDVYKTMLDIWRTLSANERKAAL
jgi:hypothetical protein